MNESKDRNENGVDRRAFLKTGLGVAGGILLPGIPNIVFAADKYPLIATEIGFELKPGEVVDDNHYGNRITRFLEERGISWMACVFDPSWGPRMMKSFDGFELAGDGEFFKQAMHRPPAQPPAKPAD